jgi:glutamyl-tRNA reductase
MIGLVGISYKSADIEIREKFAFTKEEKTDFTQKILGAGQIQGLVVLSTCNRTEI